MNAQQNAPISDRFSSLCARVFSPAAAILESEKTLGTRLDGSFKMADASETPITVTEADSAPKGFSKLFNYIKILHSRSWFIAETANDA